MDIPNIFNLYVPILLAMTMIMIFRILLSSGKSKPKKVNHVFRFYKRLFTGRLTKVMKVKKHKWTLAPVLLSCLALFIAVTGVYFSGDEPSVTSTKTVTRDVTETETLVIEHLVNNTVTKSVTESVTEQITETVTQTMKPVTHT